jgi:hypothetical protein
MIQVAAKDQSCPELIDPEFEERFSSPLQVETTGLVPGTTIAFPGHRCMEARREWRCKPVR